MRVIKSISKLSRFLYLTALSFVLVILVVFSQYSLQEIVDIVVENHFLPSEETRPAEYGVVTERGAVFTTSENIVLRAELHRPVGPAKTPTILVRIPFTDIFWNRIRSDSIGRFWAPRGYTVVVQGTRGRYHSGGDFEPLIHERQDGIETLTWLVKQSWYDGSSSCGEDLHSDIRNGPSQTRSIPAPTPSLFTSPAADFAISFGPAGRSLWRVRFIGRSEAMATGNTRLI